MRDRLRIANEFAAVDVRVQQVTNGVVLELFDPQAGSRIWLDALELEALTRLTVAQRWRLVDPSAKVPHDAADDTDAELVGW